jgi:mono/diheme cytochrome c family protein
MYWMGRTHRSFRVPVFWFVLGVLLSGCAPDSDGEGAMPASAESGAEVFTENCGACHGPTGRGPELAELKALTPSERRDRIRNHPIAGQIPQRLPANELARVIEFLESE